MYYLAKRPFIATGNTPDFGHVAEDEVVLVDVAALSDERWKTEDLRVQLSNERSRHESTRATLTEVRALLSGAEEHARRLEEREGELENALKGLLCNHGHAGIICLDPHKHMACMDECKAAREALKEKP